MKKAISYLIVGLIGMLVFILNARALSPHAEEILDIISEDRKLNITDISTIPPSYVEGDEAYDLYYSTVVNSYISNISEVQAYFQKNADHDFQISVFCKTKTNCGIIVQDDKYDLYVEEKEKFEKWVENDCQWEDEDCYPGYGFEHFDVNLKIEDASSVNEEIYKKIANLGSVCYEDEICVYNYLYDLGYINFLYNTNYDLKNLSTSTLNAIDITKIYNYFPDFKDLYENIDSYKSLISSEVHARGGNYISSGGVIHIEKKLVSYYKNVAYYHNNATFKIFPVLLVSDKIGGDLIDVAKQKIINYIDNDKIIINITRVSEASEENIKDINEVLNAALKTNTSYTSDKYKLTIGDKETDLYIVKVPEKYVDMFNTKSYSLNTGIEMTTTGLDVPFDSSLEVKDVTKDYKEDESIVVAYDINLYSLLKDGYVTESQNGFKIMMPVENDFVAENKKVYYVDSDGKKEEYDFSIEIKDNKKYVTFITNHLSTYAIAQEVNDETENNTGNGSVDSPLDNPPQTGYIVSIASLIAIGTIGGISLYLSKKKNKVHKI